jgi:ATP-dependent 26S proteasome regulatory subunit
MHGACEESLLNKLLNEMDGLRADTSTLFLLTTNRPEQLEAALASRPGRIDQAIEFPLPDKEGRRKLVRLYSRGLQVSGELEELIATRTNRASAAFIKELMRRSAQYLLQNGGSANLSIQHVEAALDEMLFSGGSLNLKLLGVAAEG